MIDLVLNVRFDDSGEAGGLRYFGGYLTGEW
jgi:hypothetical protein